MTTINKYAVSERLTTSEDSKKGRQGRKQHQGLQMQQELSASSKEGQSHCGQVLASIKVASVVMGTHCLILCCSLLSQSSVAHHNYIWDVASVHQQRSRYRECASARWSTAVSRRRGSGVMCRKTHGPWEHNAKGSQSDTHASTERPLSSCTMVTEPADGQMKKMYSEQ